MLQLANLCHIHLHKHTGPYRRTLLHFHALQRVHNVIPNINTHHAASEIISIIHSFDAHGKTINACINGFRFYLKLFVVFVVIFVVDGGGGAVFAIVYVLKWSISDCIMHIHIHGAIQ